MATGFLVRAGFLLWASLELALNYTPNAEAGVICLEPSGYLGFVDSPFHRTNGFSYFYLEDFEDGFFNTPGVVLDANWLVLPPGQLTDSVDADDGMIDDSGMGGHSFFSNLDSTNLTLTFLPEVLGGLPTHAGVVLTDVGTVTGGEFGKGEVRFEARGPDGAVLCLVVMTNFGNGGVAGSGAGAMEEDRFFGAINAGGISSISLTVVNCFDWEADHLQYGRFQPALRIERTALDAVLIAWPTNAPGFVLQTYDPAGGSWNAVTNVATTVDDEHQVTISPLSDRGFFRLIDL